MATTKNITMKQFNGTDYDTLYPKTIGAQIAGAVPIASGGTNGTTAPSGVNNLVAGLSQITPSSNDLFPFRDISGNTGGSVTLANLVTALGNSGAITSSNLASQASALGFTKIQTGSYVGTGTYGADNPCSLTFDFAPKTFMMLYYTRIYNSSLQMLPLFPERGYNGPYYFNCVVNLDMVGSEYYTGDYVYSLGCNRGYGNMKKSADGKTLTWYKLAYSSSSSDSDAAQAQFNYSNYTYYWIALG